MSNGTFYSLGAKYLSHYGRKGMKWGKNIFEDPTAASRASGSPIQQAVLARYNRAKLSAHPTINAFQKGKQAENYQRVKNAALLARLNRAKQSTYPSADTFSRGKQLENQQRTTKPSPLDSLYKQANGKVSKEYIDEVYFNNGYNLEKTIAYLKSRNPKVFGAK